MQLRLNDKALVPLEPYVSGPWPMERLVAHAIERVGYIPPAQRVLVVPQPEIEALETALNCSGALGKAKDLVNRVLDWAGITIGHIRIEFTPAELRELERRAERMGISPQELTARIAVTIKSQFFTAPPDMTDYAEPARAGAAR